MKESSHADPEMERKRDAQRSIHFRFATKSGAFFFSLEA